MSNIVELEQVMKKYDSNGITSLAVNKVSFNITKGSFVGIMGASGSGKSTLLNLISTIDKATEGKIKINGQEVSNLCDEEMARFRKENLGFIFQDYNLLDTLSLRENIALALTIKKLPKETINKAVSNLSVKLEIESVLDKFPYEVSGGQRQRCACARAIASSPQLILADEPTGALDSHSAKNLMEAFVSLNQSFYITILMVTHDALSASYCNRILFMQDGTIQAELVKENESKHDFFLKILNTMALLAGDDDYVS